jgi:hypothetical protein
VFGVGYIFKTKKVLFTANGKEVDSRDLPLKLQNKILYPAISVGSREHHKVEVNLGVKKFIFDLESYIKQKYYHEIYLDILNQNKQENKVERSKDFHNQIMDYLSK